MGMVVPCSVCLCIARPAMVNDPQDFVRIFEGSIYSSNSGLTVACDVCLRHRHRGLLICASAAYFEAAPRARPAELYSQVVLVPSPSSSTSPALFQSGLDGLVDPADTDESAFSSIRASER